MVPLRTQMTGHWRQRPGRRPARLLYHWHMLFHDQPERSGSGCPRPRWRSGR